METVTGVGQWAVRGGIVDVFSPAGSLPVRLELAGDDIESLRTFDPTTQRSTGGIATLLVLPMLTSASEDGAGLGHYLPADAPVALIVTDTLMRDRDDGRRLAESVIEAAA